MKIELHILQNFSPSNLNRDDTGAPKDCELGGHRRARISSQCLKRAARQAFESGGSFTEDERTARTKRLVDDIAQELEKANPKRADALRMAQTTLEGTGLGIKEDKGELKTEYLLFIPRRAAKEIAEVIERNWDSLMKVALPATPSPTVPAGTDAQIAPETEPKKKDKKGDAKKDKAKKKAEFPPEIGKEVAKILADGSRAPALALFGRMIADKPQWNVDAACQVAHAFSTHRVSMEFDFYTAVDDLKPSESAGSDMMGTVQFNSACLYRYSVVDVDKLTGNLADQPPGDLVGRTVTAYFKAAIDAIPTGKQNGMAAHNPPSFVLAIARDEGVPVSLANAFLRPVRPSADMDLVDESIKALMAYLDSVSRMHGKFAHAAFCADRKEVCAASAVEEVESCADLLEKLATWRAEARS